MNYSKQILSFADNLINNYATYSSAEQYYFIHISDVPEFDIHELAAMIMANDDAYANEATGADNPAYDKTMLPALLAYLKNTTDRDAEIEFTKAWRDGVTSYFASMIEELLNDRCNDYSHSQMNEHGFFGHIDRNTGEFEWRRSA